ncbi:MAG: hypothetical protein EIB84_06600 [Spiroplasma poulsonii]|uniref:Uncharacterized protein n=1 Tax=Spiroplasma poulsonii TaxID=2138 RepID=A0A2P6FAJ5_9MOLU|nr:hypothetical protein [Spiroplasma poulsonii]KAF0851902.1 putative chitinase-like [Spiroplasma poulsonii]MBW1242422.1 hypothetical protein [Spiroplasma poulsonii]PQM30485.1 hypothetical protein SMSRO_SF002500 [Spiroplasma poulsonii]PWF98237.1 hypothetical protein SMH99_07910 [Spiroplasma poulsonii]
MKKNKKKWKKIIYAINIKLFLLDICLIIFIILILYFSFCNISNIVIQPTSVTDNKQINEIIKNTDLGEFITNNLSKPAEQQIKDKLKELNPQLDITKINVTHITNNSATITSNDENIYTKNVIVNYTVSISSINW